MTSLPFAASLRSDIILLLTGVAWPLLIGVILWRLAPTLRTIMESRGFTVKAAGAEITVEAGGNHLTVQQASDQIHDKVEDLREQVSALKQQVGTTGAAPSPITDGLPNLRCVLWVDDHPENNAYETKAPVDKGIEVVQVRSTAEALTRIRTHRPFDVVISDMGRTE